MVSFRYLRKFSCLDPLRNHGVKSHLISGSLKPGHSAEIDISLRFRSSNNEETNKKVVLENEKSSKNSSLIFSLLSTADNHFQNLRLTVRSENSTVCFNLNIILKSW